MARTFSIKWRSISVKIALFIDTTNIYALFAAAPSVSAVITGPLSFRLYKLQGAGNGSNASSIVFYFILTAPVAYFCSAKQEAKTRIA